MDHYLSVNILFFIFLSIYFLPSIVAFKKGKNNKGRILLFNIFAGWSFIGWLVPLFMALKNDKTIYKKEVKPMKRLFALVVIMALLTIFINGKNPVMASNDTQVDVYNQDKQELKSIVFAIGVNEYYINGKTPGVKMDAAPYLDGGRTFVPIRYLGNSLGISDNNIKWLPCCNEASLTLGANNVLMKIDKKQIVCNSQAKDIDVAPQLKPPGRTFLPARYVCEALGFEVDWQNDKYVLVWPKGQPKPDITLLIQQIEQQNINYKNISGYKVPDSLDKDCVHVTGDLADVELSIAVVVNKQESIESNFKIAENILSSKLPAEDVKAIMDYAKQKTGTMIDVKQKEIKISGNKTAEVYGRIGTGYVLIRIWKVVL